MSRPLLWIALSLLVSTFSGCILPFGDPEAVGSAIIKRVEARLDDETMDRAEGIEDVLDVRLEYTHQGASVATDAIHVEYLDEDGAVQNQPLSSLTTQTTLQRGDRVTIHAVNLTSGLIVRQGENILAQRDGLRAPWHTAEGVPLPMTFDEPGSARWTLDGKAELRASGRGFTVDEVFVEKLDVGFASTADGSLIARSTRADAGSRLELETRLHGAVELDLEAAFTQDGSSEVAGLDGRFDGWANGTFALHFDADRQLHKVGAGGDVYADGDVVAWDNEHPKGSGWRPEDLEHPLVDEDVPYEEEEVSSGSDVDATLRDFVRRLWDTRIGVGDDYRLTVETGDGDGHLMRFTFIVQVLGEEVREVGGRSLKTYRVSQSMSFVTRAPGSGDFDFDLARHTVWLSQDHYLPVHEQGTFQRSFKRQDIERVLGAAGEWVPVSAPQDATFVLESRTNFRLEEFSGDLTTAPLLALFGWTSAPQAGMLPYMGFFGLASNIGASSAEAPAMSFSGDEASDRLQVMAASSDASWQRLSLSASLDGLRVALNGEAGPTSAGGRPAFEEIRLASVGSTLRAGDYLDLCVDGGADFVSVSITDIESNTMLMHEFFDAIAAC